MAYIEQTLSPNVRLLKSRVSRPAVKGIVIAVIAVVIANVLACYMQFHEVSIEGLISVQSNNVALWFLNIMPFIFALWGQYVSTLMAHEADSMISDQTHELIFKANVLQEKVELTSQLDHLTDLPNRYYFKQMVERSIAQAKANDEKFTVVILSINTIQEINDLLGYNQGDELISRVATMLRETLPYTITLGRIGTSEFAAIIPFQKKFASIESLRDKIFATFKEPFSVDNLSLIMKTSMGSAEYPKDGGSPETLLRHAYIAAYVSRTNEQPYTPYSPQIDISEFSDLHQISEVVNAMDQNELFLQYQPKLEANDLVTEAEVLVRWQHPVDGVIPPDRFIPIIEKNKLTRELLSWVLRHALEQVAQWQREGIDIGVAINLSALDLLDRSLPQTIRTVLDETGVSESKLKLEITETTIMSDRERALEILEEIAEMNIKVSIDDFGTGYSSLAYLSQLPAVELKIDRSFVMDMVENRNNSIIVKTIIDLAHNLSMKTVAEGVETQAIMDNLKTLGCDYQQGYFISRPMSAADLGDWMKKHDKIRQLLF